VLTVCYEIRRARNKKCFEGTHVDVNTIVQKAQRSISNFKKASGVLLEMLSEGPNMPISNIRQLHLVVITSLMLMQQTK
jgi:hypothetical protein